MRVNLGGVKATIDGKVKTVTEASIRRHLKLADADGQTLQGEGPTIPVVSQQTPTSTSSTSQPPPSPPSMQTTHDAEELVTMPHDSPLLRVQSLGSDEGSLTLNELTVLCTTLSKIVESLESDLMHTKKTYSAAYTKLIMRVKKLERRIKSSKAKRRVRLILSDDEEDIKDSSKQRKKIAQNDEDLMYETGVYDYPEGFTRPSVSITTPEPVTTAAEQVSTTEAIPEQVSTAATDMDVTLAEALVDLLKSGKTKSSKPKAKGIFFQDPKEVVRREVISPTVSKISAKDKGKAIMTEPEMPLKKKDQIRLDEELAREIEAEELERIQKERVAQEEANKTAIYEE
ncbi:hypothetical protein Tco_1531856 [Tanacetum coccineum]